LADLNFDFLLLSKYAQYVHVYIHAYLVRYCATQGVTSTQAFLLVVSTRCKYEQFNVLYCKPIVINR